MASIELSPVEARARIEASGKTTNRFLVAANHLRRLGKQVFATRLEAFESRLPSSNLAEEFGEEFFDAHEATEDPVFLDLLRESLREYAINTDQTVLSCWVETKTM